MSALEQLASLDFQQSVFQPAEIELTEITQKLLALVGEIDPARVVFDPITELRLMAGDPIRYRRRFSRSNRLHSYGSTVLLIEDRVDVGSLRPARSQRHQLGAGSAGFSDRTSAGCACRRSAAVHSGKAFTTSRSILAACASIRLCTPPSTGSVSSHIRSRAGFQRSTACSAAARTKARACS